MYLMATTSWPMSSSVELGKAFLGLPEMPDFLKRVSLFYAWGGVGVKAYSLYDVDDAKAREGFVALTSRMMQFRDIPGMEINVEPLLTIEEAMPMVGLSA